ncbi:MAG: hypothetical protein ALECFALPRED_005632 [Alectoria fallacina]|uniref:Uncharacterized protein n=1 Tax=Alectoria fallacina TaxID=1903189 RepID=A0A8H3G5U7_9LECA|nr:MAG: hypothetical protein ALECFALPRED_005632 [Alectoria fallacina]
MAGLQELYRRTQNSNAWTGPRLEVVSHNQPLIHQLLEALGVLHSDEWEEKESIEGFWQGFERQGQDNRGWMYSETVSPSTQATFSPTSPTQTAFPQSTLMSKRRSKLQTDLPPITQTMTMPPLLTSTLDSVKPEAYPHAFPNQMPTALDSFTSNESMMMDLSLDRAANSMMDWSYGMDDVFGNIGSREQSVKGC